MLKQAALANIKVVAIVGATEAAAEEVAIPVAEEVETDAQAAVEIEEAVKTVVLVDNYFDSIKTGSNVTA
jgi:histidyl-tRNA synthetase